MKIGQFVCIIIFFCSIQLGRMAPFTKNSITVYISNYYPYDKCYLIEYDLSGTKIQDIANFSCSSTKGVQLDTSGTLLVAATVMGTDNKINVYNPNGELVDVTTVPSADIDVRYPLLSGSDLWLQGDSKIGYTTRGSSGSMVTQNIGPAMWAQFPPFYSALQLLDSALLVVNRLTNELLIMDPIVKTGTGTLAKVLGSVRWFYLLKSTNLYVLTPTPALQKYSYQNGVATLQYSFSLPFTSDAVISIAAMDADGTTYVLLVYKNLGNYIVGRYTDTGSTFDSFTSLVQSGYDIRAMSVSPMATCSDGFKDQDETDVDCGGEICTARCANLGTCLSNSDCTSSFCNVYGVCATPTCDDGEKNQDETDVDCGGSTCSQRCVDSKGCSVSGDCSSGVCNPDADTCSAPTCFDSVMNGDETDIDCGGRGINNCTSCAIDKKCTLNTDCAGNKCSNNLCAASCQDNILNQNETDIDCGGSNCGSCADEKTCSVNGDCLSNFCNPDSNVCKNATCLDTYQNQGETDIDCGGSNCSKCAVGKKCVMDSDCETNTCASNACANAPQPIDTPVSAPLNEPTTPGTTPINQKPVSDSSVMAKSVWFCLSVILVLV